MTAAGADPQPRETGGRVLGPVAHYGRVPMTLFTADVTDAERTAYAYLTTWDWNRTGKLFCGYEQFSETFGWSAAKVGRVLGALESRGAIRRVRRGLGLPNDIVLLAELDEQSVDALVSNQTARQRAIPIQERNQERETARARRAAPSETFVATESHEEYARAHGLDLARERERWLTWCAAEGRTYKNLNAGFSTWLHHAVDFERGQSATAPARGRFDFDEGDGE